jgi:hypothetical protein
MARMERDLAVSTDDEQDVGPVRDDDDGGRGAGRDRRATRSDAAAAAPREIAGLPLVDRPPMSREDLEFLRQYLDTRRTKLSRSRLRLIGFATVVVALLVMFNGVWLIRIAGGVILAFALIFATLIMADWRRQRVLVEADLRDGRLCRYEGVVPASRADHALVRGGLLRVDGSAGGNGGNGGDGGDGALQRIDLLPVSGKLHRTNGQLQWTWCQVRE